MTTDPAQMPSLEAEIPDTIYVWRHGDDEPINGMFLDRDDSINPGTKYLRADLVAKPEWMALLDALKPITDYMEKLVDGWHHSPEFARHPDRLGVTIKTNCGTVYEIVDALRALQKGKGTT